MTYKINFLLSREKRSLCVGKLSLKFYRPDSLLMIFLISFIFGHYNTCVKILKNFAGVAEW